MSDLKNIEDFFPVFCGYGRVYLSGLFQASLVNLDCLQEEETIMLLSKQEQDYFQRFHHAKRRREWLGGRIAAKLALLHQSDAEKLRQHSQHLTVLPDEYGKPIVTGPAGERSMVLSISHSGGYAVALTTRGKSCGIDLQKISDKIPLLTDYFASINELDLLNKRPDIGDYETRLTMLWAMKEAVRKSAMPDVPTSFSAIELRKICSIKQHLKFYCIVMNSDMQSVSIYNFHPYIMTLTGDLIVLNQFH